VRNVFVFDAYGTLFDVHAAAGRHSQAIGPKWQQLSQTWRTKHIEYTWVHSLSGRPATFWDLAQRSLDYASPRSEARSRLRSEQSFLAAYRAMDAYPEGGRDAGGTEGPGRQARDPVERRPGHAGRTPCARPSSRTSSTPCCR